MSKYNLKWDAISTELLQQLNKEWDVSSNVNAFLFARFVEKYPIFEKEIAIRGGPNVKNYTLKKSLFDRVCNKVMTCGHNHSGKKVLARNLLDKVLTKLSEQLKLSKTTILILCLVKSVPNGDIRRLKFGSGHLTRSTRLTIKKKISWFLTILTDLVFKSRKGSFYSRTLEEFNAILTNSPKSKVLARKKEILISVDKANLQ
jgi:ribosomal protein S7